MELVSFCVLIFIQTSIEKFFLVTMRKVLYNERKKLSSEQ